MPRVDITITAKRQLTHLINTTSKTIKSLRTSKSPSQDHSAILEEIEDLLFILTVLRSELETTSSVCPDPAERLELLCCEHGLFKQCNETLHYLAQKKGGRNRIVRFFRRKNPKLGVQADESNIKATRVVFRNVHVNVNRTIDSLVWERTITSTSKEAPQVDLRQSMSAVGARLGVLNQTQQAKEEPAHQGITQPESGVLSLKQKLKAMQQSVNQKKALPSAVGTTGVLANSIHTSLPVRFEYQTLATGGDGKEQLVTVRETDKDAALRAASRTGYLNVVQRLLAQGANIEAKDTSSGNTALHLAAEAGHKEIVRLLLKEGADSRIKNKAGKTPLHLAGDNGHTGAFVILHSRLHPGKNIIVEPGEQKWYHELGNDPESRLGAYEYPLPGGPNDPRPRSRHPVFYHAGRAGN